MMRTAPLPLFLLAFSAPTLFSQAPAAPATEPQPAAAVQTTVPAPTTASGALQPSITVVQNTLFGLKLDKWKKGSVRDEAGQNVDALLRDLQTKLPPLLQAADAAPGALSQAMPLVKRLDAEYDVLLRIEEAARVSAPPDQINQLQLAMTSFSTARFAYDDQLQAGAVAQEKTVSDLRVALEKQKAAATPVKTAAEAEKPCTPPKPARRKRATPAKPAAGTAANSSSGTSAKPSAGTPAPKTNP